ncbi:alpha/beta-hydrolase [Thozetella sp. PMI_491]|nr:alpha/beta-hydrolase [Thozetella sp. PMI_491]
MSTPRSVLIAALALTATLALASGIPARNCVDLVVPVTVAANNTKYDILRVDSNIDAVEFTRARDIDQISLGPIAVGGQYNISAQLCVPTTPIKHEKILLLATHGVGFDKRAFDSGYRPEEFSFVDSALAQGYATFAYDRLGAGLSSLPDAYDVLQTPLQGEVLRALTELSLSGLFFKDSVIQSGNAALAGYKAYKADKVVHVGHSYGSIITNWFIGQYGSLSAGAILTGFLIGNETAALKLEVADLAYAPEDDPVKFANRTSGYLVFGTANAWQLDSFRKETLDPQVLQYWSSELKTTLGVGELLSLGTGVGEVVRGFNGPLQMFVGEFDYGFCNGVCRGTFDTAQLAALYPDATDFDVYLQPNTGHVVSLSLNATAGYQVIFDFLYKNGL